MPYAAVARKQKGFTQADLALKMGKTMHWVSTLELGKFMPKGKDLLKLSVLLGVSVDFLLQGVSGPAWDETVAEIAELEK